MIRHKQSVLGEHTETSVKATILAIILLALAIRSLFTGRLRIKRGMIHRDQYPLLFYTMFCVYIFFGIVVWLCLSGYLMKLINLTI